jgi:hypothetical protein
VVWVGGGFYTSLLLEVGFRPLDVRVWTNQIWSLEVSWGDRWLVGSCSLISCILNRTQVTTKNQKK